jgi:hypothetical protein
VEIRLNPHLAVEIDALHKPLRDKYWIVYDSGAKSPTVSGTPAVTWQFPVLAKYRVRWKNTNPFVEAGPSFRLPQWSLATHGATGGAGVELYLRALRISPAVRFTHWGREANGYASSARNEASLLVGFSLGGTRLR